MSHIDDRFDIDTHELTPFAKWEIVDVVFSTADEDVVVRHKLEPSNPDDVHYTVIRQLTPGTVYENRTVGRKAWAKNFIVLRSDTTNFYGRLVLYVLKSPVTFNFLGGN